MGKIATWLPTCFAAGPTGLWSSFRTASTRGSSSRPCSRGVGPSSSMRGALRDHPRASAWASSCCAVRFGLERFVGRRPLRGASERGIRLSLLQVTGDLLRKTLWMPPTLTLPNALEPDFEDEEVDEAQATASSPCGCPEGWGPFCKCWRLTPGAFRLPTYRICRALLLAQMRQNVLLLQG